VTVTGVDTTVTGNITAATVTGAVTAVTVTGAVTAVAVTGVVTIARQCRFVFDSSVHKKTSQRKIDLIAV